MGVLHTAYFATSLSTLGILIAGCGGDAFGISSADAGAEKDSSDSGGVAGSGGTGFGGSAGTSEAGIDSGEAGFSGDSGFSCPEGFADCDGNEENGCEVEIWSSIDHCGSCGYVCSNNNATPTCVDGDCVLECNPGFDDCDGVESNGCETSLHTDILNCGECKKGCATPSSGEPACSGGVCGMSCDSGWADCDSDESNGCETNTLGDPANCGGCALACSSVNGTPLCHAGSCSIECNQGWESCDGLGSTGCETHTDTSLDHCGSCFTVCSDVNGTPLCENRVCKTVCNPGWGDCDGSVFTGCETNTNTSVDHCGTCNNECPTPPNSVRGCSAGLCTMTCKAGYADCNGIKTDGCEINLATDPKNCGSCGRDCMGGACTGGVCQPITIASNEPLPRGIALTSTTIYWTSQGASGASGTVKSVNKTGGTIATVASAQANPQSIVASPTLLLWANHGIGSFPGAIMKLDLTNASPTVQTFASNQSNAFGITMDSANAYWTRDSASGFVQIQKHAFESPSSIATNQSSPRGIAVDSNHDVYWTVSNGIRRGKLGSPVEIIASTTDAPSFLALDATHVYWTSSGPVFRSLKEATISPQNLSGSSGAGGQGIVVHEGFVYWCAQQAIWRIPVTGGAAVTLASGLSNPWSLAVDEHFVYWTENVANGSVRKVVIP